MDKFTASNGISVRVESRITGDRRIVFEAGEVGGVVEMTGPQMKALVETLDAERDEELGRWRWPENKAVVVYPEVDGRHWVVREDTGEAHRRNGLYVDDPFGTAASDYREVHPERKPWHDAEEGEIWVLTGAGGLEQPWRRASGKWRSIGTVLERTYDAASAIAGRRIWPEAS